MSAGTSITGLLARRVGTSLLTLLLISAVVFAITSLLPGDAAEQALGQGATPETVAALRIEYGLDRPGWRRYLEWVGGLASGDPGQSLATRQPVADLIRERLPKSLLLAALTAVLATPFALAVGVLAALRRGSRLDRTLSLLTLSMVAIPEFLVATLAVLLFAVKLRWLSALSALPKEFSPLEFVRAYAMPVLSLGFVVVAQMARMTRAAVIAQLEQPYAEMARLKGVGPARLVLRHALPNAAGPIANAVALSLSYLLGGAIIVETIFNYPGLASLMVDSVANRDMPVLQTCAMIFSGAYLTLVLLADVIAIAANPRLRHP
ncbi:MAG: ABC transporter permease [Steroidobacteraceae bacterium]